MPFAVMASNTVMEVNGRQVRARKYPWGIVNIEDEAYSDFSKLRALLIRCVRVCVVLAMRGGSSPSCPQTSAI